MVNVNEFEENLQKEFEEKTKGKLYFIFAFSDRDFEKKLMENGLKKEETVSLGGGGLCKKEDVDFIVNLANELDNKRKEFYSKNLYESLNYQLWNYEVFYTGEYKEFLKETMGFDDDFIQKNKKTINKAISDYQKAMYEFEGC